MPLSRLKREGGISLEMLTQKTAISRVEGRISWFFSSCGRKRGIPLKLSRGPQGPARVASRKASLHASCEGPLGIPLHLVPGPITRLESRPEPQVSSRVLNWISGFLWSFNWGVRPGLFWRHANLLSSRGVTVVSGLLSSGHRVMCLSLEVTQGCHTWHHVMSRYTG